MRPSGRAQVIRDVARERGVSVAGEESSVEMGSNGVAPLVSVRLGWGGRNRTYVWRDQNPLPYRLATPQAYIVMGARHAFKARCKRASACQSSIVSRSVRSPCVRSIRRGTSTAPFVLSIGASW